MQNKISYRPDIDGLRAIAVLAVFAFHLGLYRVARGGFVGVDIFFVISGYLITQIISRQIQAGSFSVAGFYRRRALRILPAFVVMVLGVISASLLLLPPVEVAKVGKMAAAASLSVSNILFYFSPSGYFFDQLNARPFLHTWSLGVEEQFYALFPLLLIGAHRLERHWLAAAVAALGIISLAISLYWLRADPNAAFFLLPARFWELMLGAAAALRLIRLPVSRLVHEVAAAVGLMMMTVAITTMEGAYLPPYWAVLPCIGAALVIMANDTHQTMVGRALSIKPMVGIGLISYSLYLWHWPVITFAHFGLLLPGTLFNRTCIAMISIALAVLSWRFVERPFRTDLKDLSDWRVLAPAASTLAATTAIGICLFYFSGFPSRVSPEANMVASYLNSDRPDSFRSGTCFISRSSEKFDWKTCLGPETGKRRLILFGDSHAADLWPGVSQIKGYDVRQVTATYCAGLVDLDKEGSPFCVAVMDRFFKDYLRGNHPNDTIIVSERWKPEQMAALRKTIHAFRDTGATVVLVGPVPEYREALPRLEFVRLTRNDPGLVTRSKEGTVWSEDPILGRAASDEHVHYVSLIQAICPQGECREFIDGNVPVLSDTDHFTPEAARWLAPTILASSARP